MTTKFKKSFSPMLICWNDIKIHLGFEDSYLVPPPSITCRAILTVTEIRIRKGAESVLVHDKVWHLQFYPECLLPVSGGKKLTFTSIDSYQSQHEVWPPLLPPECTLPPLPNERWGPSLDLHDDRF